MIPRLVGFLDSFDRDFFELFSSVGGLGIKTALKAMVVPVNDIARAIEQEDAACWMPFPKLELQPQRK
jgi:Holliday junction DNA helicase RuvA